MCAKLNETSQIEKLAGILADYPRATLKEVAEKAGMSIATLYRQYGTREGLVDSINRETGEAIRQIIAVIDAPCDDFKEGLSRIIGIHIDSREFLRHAFFQSEQNSEPHWDAYGKALDNFFLSGQTQGLFKIEYNAAFLSDIFTSSLCGLIDSASWGRIAVKQMPELFLNFFWDGIKKDNA